MNSVAKTPFSTAQNLWKGALTRCSTWHSDNTLTSTFRGIFHDVLLSEISDNIVNPIEAQHRSAIRGKFDVKIISIKNK